MLGFGEEEAREIEKRKEPQGSAFWRKKEVCFVFIGFWKIYFLRFVFLVSKMFFFFFFLNIVLTWKIVGASKVSVIYIYIYIYI